MCNSDDIDREVVFPYGKEAVEPSKGDRRLKR